MFMELMTRALKAFCPCLPEPPAAGPPQEANLADANQVAPAKSTGKRVSIGDVGVTKPTKKLKIDQNQVQSDIGTKDQNDCGVDQAKEKVSHSGSESSIPSAPKAETQPCIKSKDPNPKNLEELKTKDKNENITSFNQINWCESKSSNGIFATILNKESSITLGKFRFDPKAKKNRTYSGDYEIHFNVAYGSLLLAIGKQQPEVIKTGSYFKIGKDTSYSIKNLRNDQAMVDFVSIKQSK